MPDLPTAEDDFGRFFDNLGELAAEKRSIPSDFGKISDATVVSPAPAVTADPAVVSAVADPVVAAELLAGDQPGPAAVAEPATGNPPPDATPQLLERFVAAMEAQKAPQPQLPFRAPAQPPLYTNEEMALLNRFGEEWPDFAKVLPILFRGNSTVQTNQILETVSKTIAPVLETTQTVAVDHQYNALQRVIPDYDAIRDPVIRWATTDPSIPPPLRGAYKNVIDNGEVGDIKWLTDSWRQATGKQAPTIAAPVRTNELSEAAKQAAVALAPVVSGRTQVVSSATPTDFDGAFEHFSKPAK